MPQPPSLAKPLDLLDRDRAWARLAEAVRSPGPSGSGQSVSRGWNTYPQ